MNFNADSIIDRYKLKLSIQRWRIATFICILICAVILFKNDQIVTNMGSGDYIARVFIDGIIKDDFDRILELEKIAKNKNIKALVVHINSPGGSAVGGENLYGAIRDISALKPVAVVMHEAVASAAYLTALAGDRIFASQGTITGSIGVIMQSFEVVDLINRLGIKSNTFKTSKLKASPNPFEKSSLESEAVVKETIDDAYNQFYSIVKERRNLSDEQMKFVANGRIFTGHQALKLNLIDEIGAEKEAINWLQKNRNILSKLPIKKVKLLTNKSKLNEYIETITNISSIINLSSNNLVLQ